MYLVNDITPAYPEHPGGILGEELKARGISQKKFAEQIGLQATHLSALIHGTRNFTPAVAAKIESGLDGISADLWMKLQEQYNKEHGIIPQTVKKGVRDKIEATMAAEDVEPFYTGNAAEMTAREKKQLIEKLEAEMRDCAKNLQFERAAELRDQILELKR